MKARSGIGGCSYFVQVGVRQVPWLTLNSTTFMLFNQLAQECLNFSQALYPFCVPKEIREPFGEFGDEKPQNL